MAPLACSGASIIVRWPIDLVSTLVSDELLRRQDRLLERRHKQAAFRSPALTRHLRL
jgi:hypothetical protein